MRKATIWFMGIAILVILLWDLAVYILGENATISVVITDWSYYSPWMPLAWGFLMGHWFAPAKGTKDK
jgi:hypothetical protein